MGSKTFVTVALAAIMGASLSLDVEAQAVNGGVGGPSSVEQTLTTHPRRPFSERLHFGFDYSAMVQSADAIGTTNAAGGVARFYGTADLHGGQGTSKGSLTFKIENRHRLGTDISPQDLGFDVGYVGLTSLTFSDADWLLTNFFYQYKSADDRWAFVAGITDVTDYVDVYALGNPWAEFSNLVFSTNPTIASPNQGFGLAGRYRFNSNWYALAGLADTNGDPSDPFNSVADFVDEPEIFAHAELGWVGDWKNRFTDNVHLTVWSADTREAAGVSSGQGAVLSASWRLGDSYIPFLRVGASDGGGALLEKSASLGVGYDTGRRDDRLAVGVNWGRPNQDDFGPTDGEQFTAEAYWRFDVFDWLEVTPDIQYIRNPALEPELNDIWVFGLRLRATF